MPPKTPESQETRFSLFPNFSMRDKNEVTKMQLTEEERYQRSKASYERNGWRIVENDIEKPYKICPVIQRACIKEQCLAYTYSRFFNGEGDQMCYKCSILNIELE